MPDLSTLPAIYSEVLEVLTLPDPAPQEKLDSPAYAVVRRLPHITIAQAATALDGLNRLGFIRVKYLLGPVSPMRTENPREWITEEGWSMLAAAERASGDYSTLRVW